MKSNPENRDKTRFPHVSTVTYEDLERGIYSQSKMYNYSDEGLYFESDIELQVGEKVFIGIDSSPYAEGTDVYECYHAVIRWRRDLEISVYKYGYGVEYYDPARTKTEDADKADTSTIHPAEQEVKVTKDNRKHPRLPTSKMVNCFSKDRIFKGRITNIARSGAYIETVEQFQVGDKFAIALPFANKDRGAMVKAEVIWKDEKGFGVKFKRLKRQKS